jgi:hypothetical protein
MYEIEAIFLLLLSLLVALLYSFYELGIYFIFKVTTIIIFAQIALQLILVLLYSKPKELREKRILITGAASGVGRLLASKCAQQGAHVVLWDIRVHALEEAGILTIFIFLIDQQMI